MGAPKIYTHTSIKLVSIKNQGTLVHAKPSQWLHAISISKTIDHHFWPGLGLLYCSFDFEPIKLTSSKVACLLVQLPKH